MPREQIVRFEDWIKRGWNLFTSNWQAWVTSLAVAGAPILLGFAVFMVCYFAFIQMMASGEEEIREALVMLVAGYGVLLLMLPTASYFAIGLFRSAFKQIDGEPFDLKDLFSGGDLFFRVLGLHILGGIATMIGVMLCILPAFIVGAWFYLATPLLVDRRCGVFEAITESARLVNRDLWMFVAFSFVVGLIAGVGQYFCMIGLVASMPLHFTITAIAYRDCFGSSAGSGSVAVQHCSNCGTPREPGSQFCSVCGSPQ